jgi:hypothetical protein
MKKLFIAITLIALSLFGTVLIADAQETKVPTVQCYFRTENLNACMKRLVNQYHFISPYDYNEDTTNEQTKASYNSYWPKSMGKFSTKLEQDNDNSNYVFNLDLTYAERELLPKNDNPNFTVQCEDEMLDEVYLPRPTYKVKVYDEEGVWTGGYYDRTVTRMQ